MQHGDLDKTKVLKTKIVSMSDVRKPNSKSAEICHTGIEYRSYRLVLSKSFSGPLAGFQRLWPDMSGPQPGHVRPNPIPQRLSPGPDISSTMAGSRKGGRTCPTPDPDMSEFLTPQRLVFQILYKRLSTPTLVVSWFLTICITF
jgi:hypothetical protein